MSEAAASLPCPKCGKTAERQLSGGAGLVFKGSGFYLTDYGKNAHRTSGSEKPGSASASGSDAASGGGSSASPKASDAKTGDSKSSDAKPTSSASDKSSGTKKSDS